MHAREAIAPARCALRRALICLSLGLSLSCGGERASPGSQGPAPAPEQPSKPATEQPADQGETRAEQPSAATSDGGSAKSPDQESGPPLRKDDTVWAGAEMMGTRFSIKVWVDLEAGQTPRAAGRAIQEAYAEIDRLEQVASEWRDSSELSRFNARAGLGWVPISEDLYDIFERSKSVAQASGGAFDPTFHGVGQLWSFVPGARPPSREQIDKGLALVNWRELSLESSAESGPRGQLGKPGMKIGLGAIAKGFAVDRASAMLRERGFAHHIVEGGGDTFVSGTKGGRTWMVGIQDPDSEGGGTVGALPVRDRAVVTSGGYQRYFEHEGKRYTHILDPRTGWPLDESTSARSVTVVAADATDADAFCTAVMVMGSEEGMRFVESLDTLEAVIIPRAGSIMISSGLRSSYVSAPGKPRPADLDRPPRTP